MADTHEAPAAQLESDDDFEYHLLQLSVQDGKEPDEIHEFLVECFLDDSGFCDWGLEELNQMLGQCARPASCAYAEEDDETDENALDLIEQQEDDDE